VAIATKEEAAATTTTETHRKLLSGPPDPPAEATCTAPPASAAGTHSEEAEEANWYPKEAAAEEPDSTVPTLLHGKSTTALPLQPSVAPTLTTHKHKQGQRQDHPCTTPSRQSISTPKMPSMDNPLSKLLLALTT